ncbi:hypothetical protein QOZ03_25495 [Pseudomonas aeruginosa]|uniref:hypothetical protein n=1 Tax=Pseudomonas aeruginosa TaxID=287 RepID=UPI001371DD46|nr:hypothetical protein [Pseudomonas aeruginosa]MYM51868.1 hypothetical protein [Pseudomonas aeruginosa]
MDLDRLYLPHWQFSEHHQRLIDAPAAAVLDAVEDLLRFDDPLVRAFLVLREAPGRLAGRPRFGLHEFTRLERRADQAIAYGLVGRFWRADFALERIADGEHFRCYDQPGVAKLVLCFRCTPSASGTLLHTETRVFCPDRASRLRFTPYWLAIRPVSGLIRRRLLAGIERRLG